MAKQHFYSCVPARMSLYNKMDGYDTFSHSEGITREQIEKELALVYDNKPAKDDAVLIRDGALPPVYCQFTNEDDTVIQSTVSFIKSDYTGERSSYMVHSLLLSDKEKAAHLESPDAAAFNPKVFKTDLSDFDLNSPDLRPDVNYPEVKVPARKATDPADIAEKYDTGTLKRIIFSLVSIVCGKTKALYLGMPSEIDTFSADCLEFINGILQIFPYFMRKQMSFVTYVGDVARFSGFKIKCITEDTPALPISKGITIKTGIKEFTGVTDETVAANAVVVDFFYGLLKNGELRKEFIEFCSYATEKNPAFKKANLKTLGDLIFLFRYLSGAFDEKAVIPNDDALYAFVSVYDKNREYIKDEYRARAMDCLKRYPETHTAIPKNVFGKVVGMYPTETEPSRSTVMDVVLELIHTDVMRDKLFGFMKQVYDNESPDIKKTIMLNICSVYYGGFLQEQILEFFKARFENEPEEIRSAILEKLFLTVRTPKVQGMVLGFIDEFYGLLSESEKQKFYEIVYEMLPEGDQLSRALADVIDLHVEEERKGEVAEHIISAVEADEKRSKPALCKILCTKCGFTESVIAEKVTGEWKSRKIVDTFVSCICAKKLKDTVDTVAEVWSVSPDMPESISGKILEAVKEKSKQKSKYDLFELIDSVDTLGELEKRIPASAGFVKELREEALLPLVSSALTSVFEVKRYPDGVERLVEIAETHREIKQLPEYENVSQYLLMMEAADKNNALDSFVHSRKITDFTASRGAAVLFERKLKSLDTESLTDEELFLLNMTAYSLKADEIRLIDAASVLKDRTVSKLRSEDQKSSAEVISAKADEITADCVLKSVLKLYESDLPEETRESLLDEDSEFEHYLSSFVQRNQKKGKKFISANVDPGSVPKPYSEAVSRALSVKPQGGGFLKKLFKK